MTLPQRHEGAESSTLNDISGVIVDCAIQVHKTLGPGLLESIYEEALCYELDKKGVSFEVQIPLNVPYKDITLKTTYRLDLIVENQVVVELKSVEKLIPLYNAQLMTYLKITNKKLGLILNFNAPLMKDGIKRIIL